MSHIWPPTGLAPAAILLGGLWIWPAILAGANGPPPEPTIGVTAPYLAGLASWSDFTQIWVTWWLGAAGAPIATVRAAP